MLILQIEDEKPLLKKKLEAAADNSQQVVTEVPRSLPVDLEDGPCQAAHTAAFGSSGLGRSLTPSAKVISGLQSGALSQFVSEVHMQTAGWLM